MNGLSRIEVEALHDALDDEYRAWATYDRVIRDFGDVRPFVNIRDAEARHIEALRSLFRFYGLEVPPNTWPERVAPFADVQQACDAGVEAEIENARLYVRLLQATERPDILAVFVRLRDASQTRHLPAFRRCAERNSGGRHRRHCHRGGGPA